VLAAVYGLYFIQVGAWVTRWERRGFDTVGLTPERAGRKVLRGAGLGVTAYLAMVALLGALGMVEMRSQPGLGVGADCRCGCDRPAGLERAGTRRGVIYRGWLLQVVAARTGIGIGRRSLDGGLHAHALRGRRVRRRAAGQPCSLRHFWSLWALAEGGLWGVFGWHAVTSWVSENLVVVGEGVGYGRLQDGLVLGMQERDPTA
jgi:hypothetical protein